MNEWVSPVCLQVILASYPRVTQRVSRLYHRKGVKPSAELQALIINFCYEPLLSVPHSTASYVYTTASHARTMRALALLQDDGYIELHRKGQHGKFATAYRRTPLFEATFRFRKLPRWLDVPRSVLTVSHRQSLGRRRSIASISGLETYAHLILPVKLSLSNGGQVFEDVWLRRGSKTGRLYQRGWHGYQGLPPKERAHLLINGRPAVEVDYISMHPNMLRNKDGHPCFETDIYSTVLRRLGARKTADRRGAIKPIVLSAFNNNSVRGYCICVGQQPEYQAYFRDLEIKPKDIPPAIIALYPELKPYVCTGKHETMLQRIDGEIMIDALETLAQRGIVSLPEHDSVICPREHQETVRRVMIEVYQRHMGFTIGVKVKQRPEGRSETLLSDEEVEDLDRAIDLSWVT